MGKCRLVLLGLSAGVELAGKTLGIIGFGPYWTGKTGTIAKAMGMNVLAYDSHQMIKDVLLLSSMWNWMRYLQNQM